MASVDKIFITPDQYPEFVDYIEKLDKKHDTKIVESLRSPAMFNFDISDDFPVAVFPTYVDIWILEDRENCPDWIYDYVCDQYGLGWDEGCREKFSDKEFKELDLDIHLMRLEELVERSLLYIHHCRFYRRNSGHKIVFDNPVRDISLKLGPEGYDGAVIKITFSKIGKYEVSYSYEDESLTYSYESLKEVLQFLNDVFSALLNPLMTFRKKILVEDFTLK